MTAVLIHQLMCVHVRVIIIASTQKYADFMAQLVFSSQEGETPIPGNGCQSWKLINFFDHLFSWHRKGAALGSKNFLLSCHITMVSAGTPECQLLKLDDVQLFSLFKPLGFQSMSIINMCEKTSTHGLILRSIMAQSKLQLFKRGFQAAKFCLLFL